VKINSRSILGDEWPELRGILEAWLDEGNFNNQGEARTSLFEMMSRLLPTQEERRHE
jgi:hypothetical protein